MGACDASSACTSVLATMNSTPSTWAAIIRLMALPPPPPTPITLILAPALSSSEKSTRRLLPSVSGAMHAPIESVESKKSTLTKPIKRGCISAYYLSLRVSLAAHRAPQFSRPTFFLRIAPQPHPVAIGDQTDHGCVGGIAKGVRHFSKTLGFAEAHGKSQDLFRHRREPAQFCSTTHQDHARPKLVRKTGPLNFNLDQFKQFTRARQQDVAQHGVVNIPRRSFADAGYFQKISGRFGGMALAPGALHFFRLRNGRSQAHGNIIGKMVAPHRDGSSVTNLSLMIHNQVRGTPANVHQGHAQLAFVRCEAGQSSGQWLKNYATVRHFDSGQIDRGHNVLVSGGGGRNQVDVHFQSRPNHAHGTVDAILRIEQIFLLFHIEPLAVRRQSHTLRRLDDLTHILALHFASTSGRLAQV